MVKYLEYPQREYAIKTFFTVTWMWYLLSPLCSTSCCHSALYSSTPPHSPKRGAHDCNIPHSKGPLSPVTSLLINHKGWWNNTRVYIWICRGKFIYIRWKAAVKCPHASELLMLHYLHNLVRSLSNIITTASVRCTVVFVLLQTFNILTKHE